jgi:hypothetical protein
MSGEEMAALAALQKQVNDLKGAIYYLTEKLSGGVGGAGGGASSDVVAALEALSGELKSIEAKLAQAKETPSAPSVDPAQMAALGAKIDEVGRAVAAQQGGEFVKKLDDYAVRISALPDQLEKKLDVKLEGASSKLSALPAQFERRMEESSAKIERKLEESSAKLSRSLEDPASKMVPAKLDELAQQIHAVREKLDKSGSESQTKQIELLTQALALMKDEMNSAKTTYTDLYKKLDAMPTGPQMSQQLERAAGAAVRSGEAQAAQERRLMQLGDHLARLESQIEVQRKQEEVMANALNTLVREMTNIDKNLTAIPNAADVEKKVMRKLSEKLSQDSQ